jgi:type 1 fimbriae regulatory protein FimB
MPISAKSRARKERRREYLSANEIDKLLVAAKSATRNPERDYCALLLMFRHGLRVSELCTLQLSDINLELRELYVRRVKGSDSGVHPLFNGETQAIQAWLRKRAEMNPPLSCQELFLSERRRPMSRVSVWVMVRHIAAAAGLEALAVHPHCLRHSTGFDLINKGTDVRVVQSYLGHRAISSTVRYTKLDSRRFAKLF